MTLSSGRSCLLLFLNKRLDCVPKASLQGRFPYSFTSYAYLISETKNQGPTIKTPTKVQQSKCVICLHWLTYPVKTYQHPGTGDTCCCLCLIQGLTPIPTHLSFRAISLLCDENVASGCVLCLLQGPRQLCLQVIPGDIGGSGERNWGGSGRWLSS